MYKAQIKYLRITKVIRLKLVIFVNRPGCSGREAYALEGLLIILLRSMVLGHKVMEQRGFGILPVPAYLLFCTFQGLFRFFHPNIWLLATQKG